MPMKRPRVFPAVWAFAFAVLVALLFHVQAMPLTVADTVVVLIVGLALAYGIDALSRRYLRKRKGK
jgi:hypothetical protein